MLTPPPPRCSKVGVPDPRDSDHAQVVVYLAVLGVCEDARRYRLRQSVFALRPSAESVRRPRVSLDSGPSSFLGRYVRGIGHDLGRQIHRYRRAEAWRSRRGTVNCSASSADSRTRVGRVELMSPACAVSDRVRLVLDAQQVRFRFVDPGFLARRRELGSWVQPGPTASEIHGVALRVIAAAATSSEARAAAGAELVRRARFDRAKRTVIHAVA